jgi:hypothetical protein
LVQCAHLWFRISLSLAVAAVEAVTNPAIITARAAAAVAVS